MFTNILNTLDDIVWGIPTIILILATGLLLTIRLRGVQFAKLGLGIKSLFKKPDGGKGELSPFQALCTALSATIGTGNIVGVATAIAAGGPGALFWMWFAALLGTATKYTECMLAVKYREHAADGHVLGGPFYTIEKGMKEVTGHSWKWLAALFAIFGVAAGLLGIGTMTQINGITSAVNNAFDPSSANIAITIGENSYTWATVISGAIVTLGVALVVIGGLKRISKVAEKVVPAMAVVFIFGSLVVIFAHANTIPAIFGLIFKGAFTGQAIAGGALGWVVKNALSKGVARGLFSNEAGMGSTPHAHAVAKVPHPAEQGYIAMIGVFIDTFIILDLTAFVVIGSYIAPNVNNPEIFNEGGSLVLSGAALAQAGFSSLYGSFGNIFIALCLTFFAFSTVIGWYFFGEANWRYLFGTKSLKIYAFIVALCVFFGAWVITAGVDVESVWTLQDALNGLMVIPNLIGILALTGVAVATLKENIEKFGLK